MGIWTWFLTTKFGRFLAGAAAAVIAIGAALLFAFSKGKKDQAGKDAAANARAEVDAAKTAQETYADATEAVAKVDAAAKQQPPPDTDKRDDLDNSF